MARGCQVCPPKVPACKSHVTKLEFGEGGCPYVGYSESTILPGGVPVEKGEPEITLGAPVEEL